MPNCKIVSFITSAPLQQSIEQKMFINPVLQEYVWVNYMQPQFKLGTRVMDIQESLMVARKTHL